jgi:hypothetical protein
MIQGIRVVLSFTLFSLSTGCSSVEWVHPNKPQEQFEQDYDKCNSDALRDPKLQQGIRLLIIEATERCVQKQGWRLVEKE